MAAVTICSDLMGGVMLSKSLIQFSVDGFPLSCLTRDQTMVGVMKIMTSFKRSPAGTVYSVSMTLQQATLNLPFCRRPLDTYRQVWVSLLWGQCSFLLSHGAHKVLFVPSRSLFPQCCVSAIIKSHCNRRERGRAQLLKE